MSFVVIEGDNGSGKTTLSKELQQLGYQIISEDGEIKSRERKAKLLKNNERVTAFYDYNEFVAYKALRTAQTCIVVRYWPSTLSAAYADDIINEEELVVQCSKNIERFPLPSVFVYLKCNDSTRVKRIQERVNIQAADDNCDKERSDRYRKAIEHIAFEVPAMWLFINSDVYRPDQLVDKLLPLIGR